MKQSAEKDRIQRIIKEWKKVDVGLIKFKFACGGDEMYYDELDFVILNTKRKSIDVNLCEKLLSFFSEEVFKKVEFYSESSGSYIGESGVVHITLDDNEKDFIYDKRSTCRLAYTQETQIKVSAKEKKFIEEFVNFFEGSDGSINFNFRKDFVLTDQYQALLRNLEKKIIKICEDLQFDEDGQQDWIRYDSGGEVLIYGTDFINEVIVVNNKLSVWVTRQFNQKM